METYHKKSKIGRGNRFFRGLSKRTNHRFLQTRETVPLMWKRKVFDWSWDENCNFFKNCVNIFANFWEKLDIYKMKVSNFRWHFCENMEINFRETSAKIFANIFLVPALFLKVYQNVTFTPKTTNWEVFVLWTWYFIGRSIRHIQTHRKKTQVAATPRDVAMLILTTAFSLTLTFCIFFIAISLFVVCTVKGQRWKNPLKI